MNKPLASPVADPDIGPLDEHGQQVWSPDEEAAIGRLRRDPVYVRSVKEALADARAGNVLSHEQHLASMAEMKRRWFAERDR